MKSTDLYENETSHDIFEAVALQAFIGRNVDYYASVFRHLHETNKKFSWNWAAFFGGSVWALYRGVYSYSVTKHYIRFALNPLAYAMYGNWVYKQMMEYELVATEKLDSAERMEMLERRGGITLSPFIFLGFFSLLYIIVYLYRDMFAL